MTNKIMTEEQAIKAAYATRDKENEKGYYVHISTPSDEAVIVVSSRHPKCGTFMTYVRFEYCPF